MATNLLALAAVAAANVAFASDRILTDDFEGATRLIVPTSTGPIEAWFWPTHLLDNTSAPGVVMLHGCSGAYGTNGYGDESHISRRFTDWARRLNAAGMHALLVDSFSTRDPQHAPADARQDYCGDRHATIAIGATEEVDRPRDALAAYNALIALHDPRGVPRVDPVRVAVMGWSHGGSAALASVAAGVLQAQPFMLAQAFYPGCGLYGAFGNAAAGQSTYAANAPVDLYLGADDTIGVASTCAAHADSSSADGGAPVSLTVYEQAGHSFDGADCVARPDGPLLSPWTGTHYTCSGSYNGEPFDLYDFRAALDARQRALCALTTAFELPNPACALPPPLP